MEWDTVVLMLSGMGSFLVVCYFLFFKSFLKELGKQSAELSLLQNKTITVEQIKSEFDKDFEGFKDSLQRELESVKAEFQLLVTKQAEIFTLEKESILEFNHALTYWLWDTLSYSIYNFNTQNFDTIQPHIQRMNNAYNKVQIAFGKLTLVCDNEELIQVGRESISIALELKHFLDGIFNSLLYELKLEDGLGKQFLEHFKKYNQPPPGNLTLNLLTTSEERKKELIEEYKEKYISKFLPAKFKLESFAAKAKETIKNN